MIYESNDRAPTPSPATGAYSVSRVSRQPKQKFRRSYDQSKYLDPNIHSGPRADRQTFFISMMGMGRAQVSPPSVERDNPISICPL
jgi:hypothetical protein